jgi:hypothetical protein
MEVTNETHHLERAAETFSEHGLESEMALTGAVVVIDDAEV